MRGQRESLRGLPQVDRMLRHPGLQQAAGRVGADPLRHLVRGAIARLRQEILAGQVAPGEVERRIASLPDEVAREAEGHSRPSLRAVINATGVLLHTNLGRAPLSAAALERVRGVSASYSTLEYDLGRRGRGARASHLERLVRLLFPGCSCHVVNNNAAALVVALQALAAGREVIVSRGELIEIGGSFRIPEILAAAGVRLREVGATNRTRRRDYERALGPDTGAVLKVHPSNYRIVGFTASVPLPDLAALCRRRRVPLIADQGSGLLVPLAEHGLTDEPTVGDFLRQGADLVLFSGDKLLGGPQAGLIVGKPALVRRLQQHPLSRALRVDKMALASLEATLEAFVRGRALEEVPVLRLLARPAAELEARARRLEALLRALPGRPVEVEVARGSGRVGGGASPQVPLPSWRLGLRPAVGEPSGGGRGGGGAAARLERILRQGEPPVVGLLARGRLWIDLRSVPEADDAALAEALSAAARALGRQP
jgi:L-seryl-tRNA(Ser) seleniumtransferase